MRQTFFRILSAILACFLLTACAGTPAPDTPVTEADTTIADTTTIPSEPAYVPEVVDLGGRNFHIMLRTGSWTPKDIWAEGMTGEALNDRVYERNTEIEKLYNTEITAEIRPETTGNALNAFVEQTITAGEDTFDLMMFKVADCAKLSQKQLFFDLLPLEDTLNLHEAGWLYDKMMETTVGGRLFYTTGLITNAANALNICFFNKDIAKDTLDVDLYALVREGRFTYDAMAQAAAAAGADVNGDGQRDLSDRWGISGQVGSLSRMLYCGSGESMITKDAEDHPILYIGTGRSVEVCDKISTLVADKNNVFIGETKDMKAIFYEGRALFFVASLQNATDMRQYALTFGLLPLPKYDEEQEDYYCYLNAHNPNGTVIPVTVNAKESAAILQALQYYSQEHVIPAYYDIVLEGQALRDKESAEMLDIIFASWTADLADTYNFGSIGSQVDAAIIAGSGLASTIASLKPSIDAAIAGLLQIYAAIES